MLAHSSIQRCLSPSTKCIFDDVMPESERVRSPGTKVSLTAQVNTYNCNQLCHFANFRIRTMLCLAQNHNSQVNCTLRHPANILELSGTPASAMVQSFALALRGSCQCTQATTHDPRSVVYIHTKAALPGETGRDAGVYNDSVPMHR